MGTRGSLLLVVALAACSSPDTEIVRMSVAAPADASDDHDEHHGAVDACETIGRTGRADTCLLFAYCGHRHLQLDCAARFTCVCSEPDVDAGATKRVVAEPVYCESAPTELRFAFDAARVACDW